MCIRPLIPANDISTTEVSPYSRQFPIPYEHRDALGLISIYRDHFRRIVVTHSDLSISLLDFSSRLPASSHLLLRHIEVTLNVVHQIPNRRTVTEFQVPRM